MTPILRRKWRTKDPFDESERRDWKVGLKLNIQKTKIMAFGPITSWQIDGETVETVTDFIFGGFKNTADGDCSHVIKRCLLLGRKVMSNLDSLLKNRHYFVIKHMSSESYSLSSSHVWMWELDLKLSTEELMLLNCGVGEDSWEIQPVHPKGNQSWIFIARTDAEAETPILWPPDTKNWFIWKDPDVGKDWRREKMATEDEMVGWHHWLNGHEFE